MNKQGEQKNNIEEIISELFNYYEIKFELEKDIKKEFKELKISNEELAEILNGLKDILKIKHNLKGWKEIKTVEELIVFLKKEL